ncbi:MAG: hypothetical protein NZ772_19150 [Cyanobacteria bacterium]|nr:hypothetical protein [Cyanobacteriota bacterium]
MLKSIRWWSIGLLCTIFITIVTTIHTFPIWSQQPKPLTVDLPKQELAKIVLQEAGIAQRYNLYLGNAIDMTTAPTMNRTLITWLHSLLRREAGWHQVEAVYAARLTDTFSETELNELLVVLKQPIVRKLLQAELNAYVDAGETRRKLFNQVWEGYNSGVFSPPANLLP